jgi:hypothetical protein
MANEGRETLLKNIETYIDKMIAEGRIPLEQREKAIEEYKIRARIY